MFEERFSWIISVSLLLGVLSAINALYCAYRWTSQYADSPGEWKPFRKWFGPSAKLTASGREWRIRFWKSWLIFVICAIVPWMVVISTGEIQLENLVPNAGVPD